MPVTIGTMTSNVNVVDGNSILSDALIEQIVKQVMLRLRDQLYAEEQSRQEQEIRDRMIQPEPY